MLKVGAAVALVVWIAERPGFVRLEWMEYAFTIHVGLFLLFALAIILGAIFTYNIITAFVKFPSSWRRYKHIRGQEKGYEALTIGLTAVAAGDSKVAAKQARLAEKYLQNDTGLPLLLKAQSARLEGREDDALENFAALLEDKNAAFLGVRGLLQAALDNQDYDKALELASHALKLHPKQPWIVRVAYDLHIRLRQWNDALEMLSRAQKVKALTADEAKADRIAILVAKAEDQDSNAAAKTLQRAVKLDAGFTPAAARLARVYLNNGQRRKALSLIKKAWKSAPHPDLVDVWTLLISSRKAGAPLARMRWIEELLKVNSETAAGQNAAGRIALEYKLWGEARAHLMQAIEIEPTAGTYRLLAELEERSGQGQRAVAEWREKAQAAAPDYVWTCHETGRVYSAWSPVAEPHGAFNTIEWAQSQAFNVAPAQLEMAVGATAAVLDVPES